MRILCVWLLCRVKYIQHLYSPKKQQYRQKFRLYTVDEEHVTNTLSHDMAHLETVILGHCWTGISTCCHLLLQDLFMYPLSQWVFSCWRQYACVNAGIQLWSVYARCVCSLELKSPSATPAETRRALPQVPAPDSEASRTRIPVDRPRLEVPPFNLPRTSAEDDGLLAYWWRFNNVFGIFDTKLISI